MSIFHSNVLNDFLSTYRQRNNLVETAKYFIIFLSFAFSFLVYRNYRNKFNNLVKLVIVDERICFCFEKIQNMTLTTLTA